jgi:hypothetical protein
VVVQYGLGDSEVTWLSALTLARTIGASLFANNVQEDNETFFGLPQSPSLVSSVKNMQTKHDYTLY